METGTESVNSRTVGIFLLGKAGDIINILPVARRIGFALTCTPDFIVANKYVPVLLGVSYVNIVKVAYHVVEIHRALNALSKNYQTVLMAQTYGRHWTGRRDISHNVIAWLNCGFTEDDFADTKKFPLVFDKRDPERERFLVSQHVKTRKPLILISVACSRSAPFGSHRVFMDAIERRWSNKCEILDLCRVKAPRIYDLLGLMEKARVLITSDSSPLHLATAIPRLPVIALLGDNPYTAARPRCNIVGRFGYNEAIGRMTDVHTAVAGALSLSPDGTGEGGESAQAHS